MIWGGGDSDLLCCVFVCVNRFCVCVGQPNGIGTSAVLHLVGPTHSDIVVGIVLLLLLTVFGVPARLFGGDIPLFPFVTCCIYNN